MFENQELNVPGYFLCYYIPSKKDPTIVSSLLLNFKNNDSENLVSNISEWAVQEFSKKGFRVNIIIRALHSNEIEAADNNSLDHLGRRLAESLNAVYAPTILKKNRSTYPIKKIELDKRNLEIRDTYYFDFKNFDTDATILIIDDIYTTGATIGEIIRSIKTENPNLSVCFFTLAKTVFEIDKNRGIPVPYSLHHYDPRYPNKFEDMVVKIKPTISYQCRQVKYYTFCF